MTAASFLVVVALLVLLVPRDTAARRRPASASRPIVAEGVTLLPDALDLLALAAASGLNVPDSLDLVARFGPSEVGGRLRPIVESIDSGRPIVSALNAAQIDPGEPLGIVLSALGDAHVSGAAIETRLVSIGSDLRAIARSREQVAARKLSVRLLLPLVVCMLPAFALLTVVPVLLEALG